jgi:hypothetical protein
MDEVVVSGHRLVHLDSAEEPFEGRVQLLFIYAIIGLVVMDERKNGCEH